MDGVTADIDLEPTERYVQHVEGAAVRLESPDAYLKRVKAVIKLSKARAAIWVTMTLVIAFVASLPIYLAAEIGAAYFSPEKAVEVSSVFDKWYDVMSPLLGAAIGALIGISIAGRQPNEAE